MWVRSFLSLKFDTTGKTYLDAEDYILLSVTVVQFLSKVVIRVPEYKPNMSTACRRTFVLHNQNAE